MRRDFLAIAVILTAGTGCDNVTWGGMDVELRPPPPRAELAAEAPGLAAALEEEVEPLPELPEGPILLAGTRSGAQATLYVVGEVRDDEVVELPDEGTVPGFRDHFVSEMLTPGSDWVLFSQGVRVGRMTARDIGLDESFCVPRSTVTGTVELVPNASGATRLLALPAPVANTREYGSYRTHSHDYDQRVGSLSLATAQIPRYGATWPPDGVLSTRQDIQAFQFVGAPSEAIAATFVFRDQLGVAPAPAGAYSLFVIGRLQDEEYAPTFTWYRSVDSDGKGAPRFFDHLDWDGDGTEEVLLDVFGAESRWFATLAQRGGSWVRTFQDSCGQTASGG